MSRIEKECKEQCNICCENKGVFISCPYCQNEACLLCQETYVLDLDKPKCSEIWQPTPSDINKNLVWKLENKVKADTVLCKFKSFLNLY
jgi:hypothetical protein